VKDNKFDQGKHIVQKEQLLGADRRHRGNFWKKIHRTKGRKDPAGKSSRKGRSILPSRKGKSKKRRGCTSISIPVKTAHEEESRGALIFKFYYIKKNTLNEQVGGSLDHNEASPAATESVLFIAKGGSKKMQRAGRKK